MMSTIGRLERYFVPDLSPWDRKELATLKPKNVFVAESPHLNEVEPEELEARRPLCGAAGKKWWSKLGRILERVENEDVSLVRMLRVCRDYRIVVMNAVQYPMDPKIAARYPDGDPVKNLSFAKVSGESNFKKKTPAVQRAIGDLSTRLHHPLLSNAVIWPLGNDADWFVRQALSDEEFRARVGGKIPHPSAWWRKGGHFGRLAEKQLQDIFSG